jgi:hypothetical protein
MWVRSEYAGELAVLSAWLSVLLPWNITYHSNAPPNGEAAVYFFRFAFFEIQFRQPWVFEVNGETTIATEPLELTYAGTQLFGDVFVATPVGSLQFYGETLAQASVAWTLAAVGFGLAFALSLALYFREQEVSAALPVSEVQLMGGLLAVGALATAASTVLFFQADHTRGITLPVGVVVVGLLAVVLLQTEKIEKSDEAA